jgi:Na+/melibiose symporter-like transporter
MQVTGQLPRSVRFGYSLGSLVTGAFGTVPGLLLLPYLTDSLGVRAGLAGVLVLLPKAWDVILNPVAGRISDRTVTRIGARRPYLLVGGIVAGILFAGIFAGPFGTAAAAPLWTVALFVLCATAYAFYQVPYNAMPAELTEQYAERTRLMTWRIAMLAVAILICGAVAPAIAKGNPDSILGHRHMGIFVCVVMVLGTLGAFVGTRRAPTSAVTQSAPTLRAQFSVARRNTAFLVLLICFVIQAAGIATMLAGVNYFAAHVLGDGTNGPTYLFAAFVGPAIVVMPLWSLVGRRLGKRSGLVISSLLFVAGALLIGAIGWLQAPGALAYVVTALVGVGYAGEQVFALAMLADCIAYDTGRTGHQQGGVLAGLWTAGETFGLALGPGIFALFLQFTGYISTTSGHPVVQPASVRAGVILGFAVAPAVLVAGGLLLLRAYRLAESVVAAGVAQPAVATTSA